MSFDKLLQELDVMAKSFDDSAKDDEKIKAAAAESEGGEDDDEDDHPEPDADNAGGPSDGDADNKPPMAKSFAFTLENGEVIEAQDGTELVKSLMERVENTEGVIAKALGQAVDLIGKQGARMNEQADLIKSLRADVTKLSSQGAGRKAVLSVAEKQTDATLAKSATSGMTKQEFFAKANSAFDAGRISGKELTVIDVSLRSGSEIDQGLMSKVVG